MSSVELTGEETNTTGRAMRQATNMASRRGEATEPWGWGGQGEPAVATEAVTANAEVASEVEKGKMLRVEGSCG